MDHSERVIYAAKGNRMADFYCYEPQVHLWTALSPMPCQGGNWPREAPGKGARGVCDGRGHVYVTQGGNTLGFWRYDIADSSWRLLPDVPPGLSGKRVKGGTDMVCVEEDSVGYVYLLKGYRCEFYRYNTAADIWEGLEDAPVGSRPKWDKGSWLVYDEDSLIYAHKAKYHDFHVYNLNTGHWDQGSLARMPLVGHSGRRKKSKAGGSACYYARRVFALKGGNTVEFWRYDVDQNAWSEQDGLPEMGSTGKRRNVKHGGDLVFFSRTELYALKGNKTREFWRKPYPPPGFGGEPRVPRAAAARKCSAPVVLANPTTAGRANLTRGIGGDAKVAVFDPAGRVVARGRLVAGQHELDVSHLSPGVYLVRVEGPEQVVVSKLVIQR